MNALATLLAKPVVARMGWTLLHFLWQGAIVWSLLACALVILRRRSPGARYGAAFGALFLLVACPAITFPLVRDAVPAPSPPQMVLPSLETLQAPAPAIPPVPFRGGSAPVPVAPSGSAPSPIPEDRDADPVSVAPPLAISLFARIASWVSPALPWIVAGWALGVLVLSIRLLGGWILANRMKTRGVHPASDRLVRALDDLRLRLRVSRPVRLLESAIAGVPSAIGWLRPVILLPARIATGLEARQIEAILAHELAHVRRRDYAANLLQSLIETLLFYHPAVWSISHRIRVERELACDDLVVSVHGDALTYARALTEIEAIRSRGALLPVAAAGGGLLDRIRRLAGAPVPHARRFPRGPAGLLALTAILLLAAAVHSGAVRPSPARGADPGAEVEALIAGLEGLDLRTQAGAQRQREIAWALGAMGERAFPRLKRALGRPDDPASRVAPEALGKMGEVAIDFLVESSRDVDPRMRRGAVEGLGWAGGPRAVEALIPRLGDEDVQARTSAAYWLGRIADPAAVDPLIAVARGAKPGAIDEAIRSLGAIGDPRAEDALIEIAEGNDSAKRLIAVRALGRLRSPRRPETIIRALADPDPEISKAAGRALPVYGPEQTVAPVAALAAEASEPAMDALAMLGTPGVEPIMRLLREGDPPVRCMAAAALGGACLKSGYASARHSLYWELYWKALREVVGSQVRGADLDRLEAGDEFPSIAALKSTNPLIRDAANEARERADQALRLHPLVLSLIRALDDPDAGVRDTALASLRSATGADRGADPENWIEWYVKSGDPWGEPRDGIRCRLRVPASTWSAADRPRLRIDVLDESSGDVPLRLVRYLVDAKPRVVDPAIASYDTVPAPDLAPGRHTLGVVLAADGGLEIESNLVEVVILPRLESIAVGPFRVETGFVPDKDEIRPAESIGITFFVRNLGAAPIFIETGGDQRGIRSDRFTIEAADPQGNPVKDPHPEATTMGGPMGMSRIPPLGVYTYGLSLDKWCAFERPGTFTATCERTIQLSADREWRPAGAGSGVHEARVRSTFSIRVIGSDRTAQARTRGTIRGTVVRADTGAPVAGAYVGIGDFGDAGGSNYARFEAEGIHAKAKTDAEGRFVLEDVAFSEGHPLVVTHPDFVRYDATVAVSQADPDPRVGVLLRPGAAIRVRVTTEFGATVSGPFILRLEALDGRRFIPPGKDPHLSAFASSHWEQKAPDGKASFGALDAGEYIVEAFLPGAGGGTDMLRTQRTYYGRTKTYSIDAGSTVDADLPPAKHETRITIKVPEYEAKGPNDRPLVIVNRNPGVLVWDDGRFHGPEDPRLGRISLTALFYDTPAPDGTYTISNLPPGTYAVFAGPFHALQGRRVDLTRFGARVDVSIPWVEPTAAGKISLWRFDRIIDLEDREWTAAALCDRISKQVDGKPRIEVEPAIRETPVVVKAGERSVWTIFEALYLDEGWGLEEKGDDALLLRPAPTAR
ncbi:MAG: HEAT repeat domain-containing protein [Planctomycetes bacterium]|nr:HEAT repeat domain-containing protein [Planctomycetota bacterium]